MARPKKTKISAAAVNEGYLNEALEDEEQQAQELFEAAVPQTDNAADIPMFADIDGRTSRSISVMRLYKLEPGGPPAYKGAIPLTATLDTIGQIYGDGSYMIEGTNHRNTVLAVKENIRISLGGTPEKALLAAGASTAESDRIERLARVSAVESHENSKSFLTYMTAQAQAQAERDRASYEAREKTMTQFFATIMQMQQASFHQTMTMVTTSNNHTVASLRELNSHKKDSGDADVKMVDMLLRGMKIAHDMNSEQERAERPAWENILESGFGVLAKTLPTAPAPTPPPIESRQKKLNGRQRQTLREALRLYRKVRARGIDPDELMERLSEVEPETETPPVSPEPPQEPEENSEAEDEDDEDDEDEDDDEDEIGASVESN